MAQTPSFGSNNPFRRKAPVPSGPAAPPSPFAETEPSSAPPELASEVLSADRFRSHLQALSSPSQPPPATSFQKPKVVKRVRVQSPPPSSPESSDPADRFPPVEIEDDESSGSDDDDVNQRADPFTYALPSGASDPSESSNREDESQTATWNSAPPNPFQKTLRDLEVGATSGLSQDLGSEPGSKGVLDVGAFGRLLMTGQAGNPAPLPTSAPYTQQARYQQLLRDGDTATADSSPSDSLQAVQETTQSSREASEYDMGDVRRKLTSSSEPSLQPALSVPKKKPPPPSSRHGKLINAPASGETKGVESGPRPPLASPSQKATPEPLVSPSRQRPPTPSDVNKPLPPAPHRSPAEEATESVFDREAAGKVPEPNSGPGLGIVMPLRPPTPPNTSHAVSNPLPATLQTQSTKKPVPPPRRQPHGRSESRNTSGASSTPAHQDDTDSSLRRSSFDSTRSRSSSLRVNVRAPAPPPPRRPSHPSRAPSSHSLPPAESHHLSEPSPSAMSTPPIVTTPSPMGDTPTPISTSSSSSTSVSRQPSHATLSPYHPHAPTTPAPAPATASSPAGTTDTATNHRSQPSAVGGPAKMAPPPPPPARNPSVRVKKRPAVGSSSSGGSRVAKDASAGGSLPPPPPPTRNRAGSGRRGSVDSTIAAAPGDDGTSKAAEVGTGLGVNLAAVQENGGLDVVHADGDARELRMEAGMGAAPASAAGDILADLDALQREVDALRGRYEKAGQGSLVGE